MRNNKYLKHLLQLLIICLVQSLYAVDEQAQKISYMVEFKGIENPSLCALLQEHSHLFEQQDNVPSNLASLKKRAEGDLAQLLKVLQSRAYYQANISLDFNAEKSPIQITYTVDTGPQYFFRELQLIPEANFDYPLSEIVGSLGIVVGEPALPSVILKAEDRLLHLLEENGRPLTKICKREVIADQLTKTVSVIFHVG